jgi:hypothetical protein
MDAMRERKRETISRFDLFWFGFVTAALASGGVVLVIDGHKRSGFCSLMAGKVK